MLYAAPVALLLFNLSQWENMFWGMAALQNFSVVLWVVATFYFLSYTHRWGMALLMAVLATLTSGNGMLVWPIGAILLLLRLNDYSPKRTSPTGSGSSWTRGFQPLVTWIIGAGIVIGLYFTGFEKPGDITYVRPGPLALLKGWLAVIGAAAEAIPRGAPLRNSILLGGLMLLATVGLSGWGLWWHHPAIRQVIRRVRRPKTPVSGSATAFSH